MSTLHNQQNVAQNSLINNYTNYSLQSAPKSTHIIKCGTITQNDDKTNTISQLQCD